MPAETHLHLARGYEQTLAAIVDLVGPKVEHIEMHYRVGDGDLDDAAGLELDHQVVWSATGMLRGGAGLVVGEYLSPPLEHPIRGSILALVDLARRLGCAGGDRRMIRRVARIAAAAVLTVAVAYFAVPVLFVVRHQVERYSRRQAQGGPMADLTHSDRPCPGGDETCPGQDGDACHYAGPDAFPLPDDEPVYWWVDFCVDECPETQCHAEGRCAFPPRDIVDVPIAGDVL